MKLTLYYRYPVRDETKEATYVWPTANAQMIVEVQKAVLDAFRIGANYFNIEADFGDDSGSSI